MANDSYTFIVVPHAKARFRKFQVSVRLTKVVGTLAALAGLLVLGIVAHYGTLAAELHSLRQVRAENESLLTKTRDYEERSGRLRKRVAALQATVHKLGVMAGVENTLPDPEAGGRGGISGSESKAPSLDVTSVERTVDELVDRSLQLEGIYEDQKLLLSSTPSIWPVRGYLSSRFGNRPDPFTGQKDFHPGIDISTPNGTEVRAPADGVIIRVRSAGAYGKSITVNHGYGVMTRYGHLSRYNVRPGKRVRRGDVIGYVGNTGRSTSPHLHYEVWVRDQLKNPIHYILDEYRSFG